MSPGISMEKADQDAFLMEGEEVRGKDASSALLEVQALQVRFRIDGSEFNAVNDVSFALAKGKALGIVGESGSGKSVTARAIMGLFPDEIGVTVRGSVRLEGRELVGLGDKRMRRIRGNEIALVFQDPFRALNPTMRIGNQVVHALRSNRRVGREKARREAIELLGLVRLPAPERRFNEYPHQLSGGMRQRVMIAIAISQRPKLLIADEPTTALDVTTQGQLMDLLVELQADLSMGLILISHDIGIAAAYTDEIAVMYAGRIVERAETRQLIGGMRMPYTRGLFESIPRLSGVPHNALPVVPGRAPDPAALPSGCAFHPRCSQVRDRCRTDRPPLVEHEGGHEWACWYPL